MARRISPIVILVLLILAGCAGRPAVDPGISESLGAAYRLDSGDRLRVVVFEEESLSNSYAVDSGGEISMPLVGTVNARGLTTRQLERSIAASLRAGYLRDPSVSVEIEAYRPFFILGEVQEPGQYPYVTGLTAKTAVAIAGGFSPRAVTDKVAVSRRIEGRTVEARVPIDYPIMPGDTVQVPERWF